MKITGHAVDKWRDLTGSKRQDSIIKDTLTEMLIGAREVYLKKQYTVRQLMNNRYKKARYFSHSSRYILVINEDMDTMITIHEGKAGRWVDTQ